MVLGARRRDAVPHAVSLRVDELPPALSADHAQLNLPRPLIDLNLKLVTADQGRDLRRDPQPIDDAYVDERFAETSAVSELHDVDNS